ncbi:MULTISPECIES: Asp23/Gls24 family envelope stress response protein [Lachnospira]|jgi:uncharacterized alkaline shock family protein YloU|uniref:Uncharacterized conserved protein YloU, alkaline shock protein (Asp23) family n=2 Tax=Lachnospira TaxID=28050 RepID=A0A1H5RNJ8_9FIRM|nr:MULTISPECIES: Asp23/Gls24 family envelope stress response protein [Lachnospira]MBQ2473338.1 Asp23/Gls24 family envelope stress response protein [Lachnospira sp.]MCR5516013.1 Asp23/Gls24 family envelope stress response protein [Lachnospira sp.]SDM73677.1 Uncharacterized conserved protein YloU, alkaline shock protein (Asp23) family [Lachnospira pectinoschiza]SEF39936.1 Uncharacterized conserved protein YloU, alkaline shock protein (Asp23) family [Lachnospira multipara]
MTKEFEDRGANYTVSENNNIGEVKISDEVVAIVAGLAATEVEGVVSLAGNITNDMVAKLGIKNLAKGVKVYVNEQTVSVSLVVNIKYGTSIPAVSTVIQEKVKSAVETMTGLDVSEVNIKISGVNIDA